MPKENNKMQVDIENLFKQNVNDLSGIKELYKKLKEVEEKISQVKYIDSNLVNKLKKDYEKLKKDYENLKKAISEDYESLKCVILDENIQAKLNDDINVINSQLVTKVNCLDLFINVKDYGVVGDGVTDDTSAFKRIFNNVKSMTKKIPIYIPPNLTCLLSSPLPLFSGLYLYSTYNNSEFGDKAIMVNKTTNMFELNTDVTNIHIQGIEFRGNEATKSTCLISETNFANGKIIKYSKIINCGFNYFRKAILGRILGCNISNNFFNNGGTCLHVSGSDNIIQNNFMDNAENLNKSQFLVMFENLSLTKFENNYLTGSVREGNGAMLMKIKYGEGLVIARNWLDFSEGCAIFFDTTSNHTIRDNFTRGNCRNPFEQYDAVFTLFDSKNISFSGNQFIDQVNGKRTFSFRKANDITKNITVRDNVYKNGYNLLIYKPSNESENIFIDEPSTTYNKGKFWNGETWNNPIHLKSFSNLSLSFGKYGTVDARASKSFDITLSSEIPLTSLKRIDFHTSLENGIIFDYRRSDTNKLSIRFTNITDSAITLKDKNFDFTVLY